MNFTFLQKARVLVLFSAIVFSTALVSNNVYSSSDSGNSDFQNKQSITIHKAFGDPSRDELDVLILVNYQRKKKKLATLKWNSELGKLAREYSKRMALEDFFDHYDSDGKSVVDRAATAEIIGWKKLGENLFYAEGYISPSALAVTGWLNSPPHRENMFDPEWTDTGIGVYEKGRKTYVTQVFLTK